MPLSKVLLNFVMLAVGVVLVLVGRTMNTHEHEEWKGEHWWRELILGPSGGHRAQTIIVGGGMIVVGLIGLGYALFSSL